MTIHSFYWESITAHFDDNFAEYMRNALWDEASYVFNTEQDPYMWHRADIIEADETDYRADDFPTTYWLYPELMKAAKEWTPWIKIYEAMKIPKEKNKLKKMLKKHPYVYIKI